MATLHIKNPSVQIKSLDETIKDGVPVDMLVFSLGGTNTAIFTSEAIRDAMHRSQYPMEVPVYSWAESHEFALEGHDVFNSAALTMSAYMRRPQHLDNMFDGLAHQGSHVISLPRLFSHVFTNGNNRNFFSSTTNSGATLSQDENIREQFSYYFTPSLNFTKIQFENHPKLQSLCKTTEFTTAPSNVEPRTLVLSPSNMSDSVFSAVQAVSDEKHPVLSEINENVKIMNNIFEENSKLWNTKKVKDLCSNEKECFMGNLFLGEHLSIHTPKVKGIEHGALTFPSVCYDKAINALVKQESSPLNGAQLLTMAMSHCGNTHSIDKALHILNPDSSFAVPTSADVDFDLEPSGRHCQCKYDEGCNTAPIKGILEVNTEAPCVGALVCLRDLHRHAICMKPMLQAMGKYSSDMTCLGKRFVQKPDSNEIECNVMWANGEDMARPGHLVQAFAFKFNSDTTTKPPVEFHMALGNDDCESLASLGCLFSENIFAFGDSLLRGDVNIDDDVSVFSNIHPDITNKIRWTAETMSLYKDKLITGNCFGITTAPSAAGTETSLENVNMESEISRRKALKEIKQNGRKAMWGVSEAYDFPYNFAGMESQLGGHSYTLHGLKIDGNDEAKRFSRFLFTFGEHTGSVTPVNCSEIVHVETMHPFGKTNTIPMLTHESANLFDTNLAEIKFKGLPQTFCQLFKSQLSMNTDKCYSIQNMMIMNVNENIVGGPEIFYRSVVVWKNYIFASPDKETGTSRPGILLHDLINMKGGIPVIPPSHLVDAVPSGPFMVPMYDADSKSAHEYAKSWQTLQESIGQAKLPTKFQQFIYNSHFPQLETRHFEPAIGYRGMMSFKSDGNENFSESVRQDVNDMRQNWRGLHIQPVGSIDISHGDGIVQQQLVYTTVKPARSDR